MNHKKPYPSAEAAARSKAGRRPGAIVITDCPCGEIHVDKPRAVASVPAPRKPPRDTGPDELTRLAVLKRDRLQCVRCGRPCGPKVGEYSLQHRVARGVGGDNETWNLILLCGSATTLCHGEVEAKSDPRDLARGYRLESWQDPAAESVFIATDADGGGLTRWLSDDGEYLEQNPTEDEAAA